MNSVLFSSASVHWATRIQKQTNAGDDMTKECETLKAELMALAELFERCARKGRAEQKSLSVAGYHKEANYQYGKAIAHEEDAETLRKLAERL